MTGADIGALVTAVIACLGALTAYLHSKTAVKTAATAMKKVVDHANAQGIHSADRRVG